jgi:hypothetical protein
VIALAGFAVLAVAQVAGPAPAPPAPELARPREAAVLALLSKELDGRRAGWFFRSRLVREPAGQDPAASAAAGRVVPKIPITCGNSMGGDLTAERMTDLARKLVAAFDGPAIGSVPRIAFDEKDYPVMDGDTFTPLAAVAADVVAKLNDARDGEDVDLSLLLGEAVDAWPMPAAKNLDGDVERTVVAAGVSEFALPTTLRFEVRPDAKGAGSAPRKEPVEVKGAVRSTSGRVALLSFPAYPTSDPAGTGLPKLTLRVLQPATRSDASSSSAMVWLPSTFDAAKPFDVEISFGAGVWTWGKRLLATAQ